MLPPLRKSAKAVARLARRLTFLKHERWVRSHQCVVPGCCAEPVEFMHLRCAANSGTSIKPHSAFGISGCIGHHAEAHRIGHNTFAAKYHINLWHLAGEFVAASPDRDMRESFNLLPLHEQALLYPERMAA